MTDPATLPDPTPRLEAAFGDVLARKMRGLPFVNPAIRVEAVAFAPWKHYWLGVMLTPWAMNLMLLPREPAQWRPLAIGEKRRYAFPAGRFDFISAHDASIGEFLMCSLFSPVDGFADHETARETARLAREALFEPEETPLDAKLAQPMSRRDLLRGGSRANTNEREGPLPSANCAPSGGSEQSPSASVGAHHEREGPLPSANCAPSGGSEQSPSASVGAHVR